MKSSSLRTAVLALMEFKSPSTTSASTLYEYADALEEMSLIASGMEKYITADRYLVKATTLRRRANNL